MTTYELNFEDLKTKYQTILAEYQQAKYQTTELQGLLREKQDRYITREQEYKDVITQMEQNIKDNSTHPLVIPDDKTEDEYLLQGIDIHDKEEAKKIEKQKMINAKNADLIGVCSKNIKDIHQHNNDMNEEIELTQKKIGKVLVKRREKIFETFDEKIMEMKEQLRKEEEKKKDNQYDYKQKEKELNEHLETMTQVAQKIDDDNRVLMKKHSELKIQFLSQENDRELLLKQLIYQKKESVRLRELHARTKKQSDKIKEAEQADEQA